MFEYESFSRDETERIGLKLSSKLRGKEIISLYGGMGMGKTTFVRGLMNGLQTIDDVSSPTFSLVNEYNGIYKVYHFDMYRVRNEDDLYSTGFYDYIDNGILIIEWSENIKEFIPKSAIKVKIESGKGENYRKILIDGVDMNWQF